MNVINHKTNQHFFQKNKKYLYIQLVYGMHIEASESIFYRNMKKVGKVWLTQSIIIVYVHILQKLNI